MNANEHFEQAEHWLKVSNQKPNEEYEVTLLARAQVHATLALAATYREGAVTIETTSVPIGVGDIEKITGIVRTERRSAS